MRQHACGNRAGASLQIWAALQERIDMASLGLAIFGESRKRDGLRAWWLCPWHDDHDPSLMIDAKGFRCWACGARGSAVDLVMRTQGAGFGQAVRWLADWSGLGPPMVRASGGRASWAHPEARTAAPAPPIDEGPSGMTRAEARKLVGESARRLWLREGAPALERLKRRSLESETIGRAWLGFAPRILFKTKNGKPWPITGIVVPWFDREGELRKVNVRRFGDPKPKYVAVFVDWPEFYALPEPMGAAPPIGRAIDPSLPLIVVEGEFEALILGQCLAGFANVITVGSSESEVGHRTMCAALASPAWFAAHDNDPPEKFPGKLPPGERAAAKWGPRAVRVRPPIGKDWTESFQAGIDLRLWWGEHHLPALFDHEERLAIQAETEAAS